MGPARRGLLKPLRRAGARAAGAATLVAVLLTRCAGGPVVLRPLDRETAASTCRGLVDQAGRPSPEPVRWLGPSDPGDRRALDERCRRVGPAISIHGRVAERQPAAADGPPIVVSWNTHVGAADLIAFIAAIRAGRFTDDQPPIAFVLLLQEAVRPAAAARARQDVALVARDTGLDAFYVPSMPNGRRPDGTVSDRGNAILSTLPLSGLTAIELPFDRQRRVAAAADLDVPVGGGLVHLRVVSAHLDATASAARLRVFASGLRERQSRALVSALAADQTVIVGVDLNTWSEAVGEPANRLLQQAFPGTPRPPLRATFRTGFLLDYLFFRLPPGVQGTSALGPDRFGSDHHPLIGRLRVG